MCEKCRSHKGVLVLLARPTGDRYCFNRAQPEAVALAASTSSPPDRRQQRLPHDTSHLEASRVTPQPMSRRQRREAERAAEAARQLAEAEAGANPSPPPTAHTTHAAGTTRRSRRDLPAHRSATGAPSSVVTAPSPSALPDVPVAPQKQNRPQRPTAPAARSAMHASGVPAPAEQSGRADQQPIAPMSRMARRRQGGTEQPVPSADRRPQVPGATGHALPSGAVSAPAAEAAGS